MMNVPVRKDNLIMFTGSSFNLTDYIMAYGSDQNVCLWNSYYPALLIFFSFLKILDKILILTVLFHQKLS